MMVPTIGTRRGLGASLPGSMAQATACVGMGWASYITQPSCWSASYDDWNNEFYSSGGTLNLTPPNVGAPTNVTTLPDTTGQAAQTLSNNSILYAQGQNAANNPPSATDTCMTATAGWPYPFDGLDCPTLFLYGAIGVVGTMLLLEGLR